MDSIGNKCKHDNCNCSEKKATSPKAYPVTPRNKIGRNQICPCGSGKKYKKCCLLKRTYIPNAK